MNLYIDYVILLLFKKYWTCHNQLSMNTPQIFQSSFIKCSNNYPNSLFFSVAFLLASDLVSEHKMSLQLSYNTNMGEP